MSHSDDGFSHHRFGTNPKEEATAPEEATAICRAMGFAKGWPYRHGTVQGDTAILAVRGDTPADTLATSSSEDSL